MTAESQCPHDHTRMLEDLRQLPTPNLGRLAQPILARVLDGDDTPAARESLRLVGDVLAERKTRRAA